LLAGCAGHGDITVPRGQDVDGGLERARSSPVAFYFAGRRFAGLPLTDVELEGPGRAVFAYGTCVIPRGQEGGCAVPVQIQNFPFEAGNWRLAVGCHRLPSLRGVPTVRHDGLVLLTRRTVVKIYARNAAEDRRVALALRDVRRPERKGRPLPAPAPGVTQPVGSVCS
jgi:hypothetical protein